MVALVNGNIYQHNGRISTCYNPQGLLGQGRWRWQTAQEFIDMIKAHGGRII